MVMLRRGAVVFLLALSTPLIAQTPTGTIVGTVTDQLGAVLPNAVVTITNKDTGANRVLQSGVAQDADRSR